MKKKWMRYTFCLVILLAVFALAGAGAEEISDRIPGTPLRSTLEYVKSHRVGDDIVANWDESTKTLTLTGTGPMYNYGTHIEFSNYAGCYYYAMGVTDIPNRVILSNGITSIGKEAFRYSLRPGEELTNIVHMIGEIDIPSSVTHIGDDAFFNMAALDSVILHEGLQYIGESAFECVSGLKQITLPSTIKKIGFRAFYNSSLQEVYYNGSPEDWKKVEVGNLALLGKKIYFTNYPHEHQYERYFDRDPMADITWKNATCTEDGYELQICTICGEKRNVTLKHTGHKFVKTEEFCQNGCGTKNPKYKKVLIKNSLTLYTPTDMTFQASYLKKNKIVLELFAEAGGYPEITYKLSSGGNKYIKLSTTGKLTLKKGLKKGTYKLKIKITTGETKVYKKTTFTKNFKITVK